MKSPSLASSLLVLTISAFAFTQSADITSGGGGASLGGVNTWTGAQTFIDDSFFVVDNGDLTKKMAFQVSGFTTGTIRTYTMPNSDGTICNSGSACTLFTTTVTTLGTNTNCASSADPAVCASAPAGSVSIAVADAATVVNTTRVTANSQIFVQDDQSLGSRLSVTCNTTPNRNYTISARVAATSFTIVTDTVPATNPACLSYFIVN